MEKLELKHIVGYLPYGLKIQNGKEFDIVTGYDNGRIISMFRGNLENFTSIEYVKPILRNLSDLTKEIEVNGEKFVPALELVKLKEKYGKWKDIAPSLDYDVKIIKKQFGGMLKVTKLDSWVILMSLNEPERMEHFVIQKLYEWHFDIHGGIGTWAIDINTLTK